MALDSQAQAATALNRFGFAPKPGSAAVSDARGALLAELDRPGAGQINNPDLLNGGEAARATYNFRQERKAARLAVKAEQDAGRRQDRRTRHGAGRR